MAQYRYPFTVDTQDDYIYEFGFNLGVLDEPNHEIKIAKRPRTRFGDFIFCLIWAIIFWSMIFVASVIWLEVIPWFVWLVKWYWTLGDF